ncbi:MAG: hypothetical protein M3O70_28535 [Actinomycetota bacterium]|nr:hypothetical protein [Actinomycetota bacterium]
MMMNNDQRTAVVPLAPDSAAHSNTMDCLAAAISESHAHGWATCDVPLEGALALARERRISTPPTRRGQAPIAVLRPTARDQAHPRSLSAQYGLEAMPLHTDGANRPLPPNVVLLEASAPCEGSTLIFPIRVNSLTRRQHDSIRSGVFAVGRGPRAFYSHAMDEAGRVRFDPGCMRPLDPVARYVNDWLTNAAEDADRHHWERPGVTVVIANVRTLHGRSGVVDHPDREIRRLMLHWNIDA